MRVMMVSHAYPPTFGGVESHVWDISHHLRARGHDVLVVAGEQGLPQLGDVPVHRHAALSASALLSTHAVVPLDACEPGLLADVRRALAAELDAFAPNVVHMHNAHHFGPEPARACLDLAEVPVLNGVHDRVGEHLCPHVLDWQWSLVAYVSEYVREALPTARPSAVRWLGIELNNFRPDGPRDARLGWLPRPVVFHPARLLRWKGVETGVRAFADVHAAVGGSLVMCASENIIDDPREVAALRRELAALAGDLGIGDAVHFLSFERARMADAYRAADLIWYPTIEEEPLGLVPMEAMACGVPLVVSRSGGMRETVTDGRTGLVVERADAAGLAEAAVAVLRGPELRGALVRGGLAAAPGFDNGAYVDWLEETYTAIGAWRAVGSPA